MEELALLEGYALCAEVAWHFATQPAVMATTALALAVVAVVALAETLANSITSSLRKWLKFRKLQWTLSIRSSLLQILRVLFRSL